MKHGDLQYIEHQDRKRNKGFIVTTSEMKTTDTASKQSENEMMGQSKGITNIYVNRTISGANFHQRLLTDKQFIRFQKV